MQLGLGLGFNKTGEGSGGSVDTSSRTAALLGDSLSAQNSLNFSDVKAYYNYGYFTWYNALALGRMSFPTANNLGVSGETVAQIKARMTDIAGLADQPDVVFFMGGTNDASSVTAANAAAKLSSIMSDHDDILDYITGLGKSVVYLCLTPRSTANWSSNVAARKQFVKDVNTQIMARNGSRGGKVFSVDCYTPMNDGSDEPVTGSTFDGLHYAPYGAYLIGNAIRNKLASIYGAGAIPDFSSPLNILTNGAMAGTSGSKSGNFTGDVPTSWIAGAYGAIVGSKDVDGAFVMTQNFSATDGGMGYDFYQDISSGFADGDTFLPCLLIETGAFANINIFNLDVSVNPGGLQTYIVSVGHRETGLPIAECLDPDIGLYLITCPALPITFNPDTGRYIRFLLRGDINAGGGTTTQSNIKVKGAGFFKLNNEIA